MSEQTNCNARLMKLVKDLAVNPHCSECGSVDERLVELDLLLAELFADEPVSPCVPSDELAEEER